MTDLPFMPMYWERFFADTERLPLEERGAYALLLGKMWVNHGWLPADDIVLARMLGVDVRVWRRIKPAVEPLLLREVDPLCGPIYRQKRLVAELTKAAEVVAKNKARTAAATAARTGKSTVKSSKAANVTSNVTKANGEHRNVDRDVDRNEHPRARVPEPQEPPSRGEGGSGPPYPHAPASAPAEGRALTGPFMPSPPSPPKPAAKSRFLRDWEAAGGDISKLPVREGAPQLREQHGDDALWDRVNAKFQPPPPPDPGEARKVVAEAQRVDKQFTQEDSGDERPAQQPERPSDDDLDDFVRF